MQQDQYKVNSIILNNCLVTPHFLFSYVPLLGQQYLLPIVHRTTCYLAKVFISEWPEIYCKEQGIHVKLLCGFVNHSGGHPLESLSGCMKTIHRIVLKRNQLQQSDLALNQMTRRLLECDYEGGTTKNTNMCTRTTNGAIDLPTHHPLPLCTFLRVFFLPLGPFFPYTCLPFQQGGKH